MQTRIFTDKLPYSVNWYRETHQYKRASKTTALSARRPCPASLVTHGGNLDRPSPACDAGTVKKSQKAKKLDRAPRIRVPNRERALFTLDNARFVGVLQRLSLTGGSAVLSKGPIPHGSKGEFVMNTVFGKVSAQIEFLHTGADGIPLAQAFRFVTMGNTSAKRFADAAKLMEDAGYSDAPPKPTGLSAPASETLGLLLHSVRRLAATIVASR